MTSQSPVHDIPHLLPPHLQVNARFEDRHEPRVANWLRRWDFSSPLDVGVVAAGLSQTSILPTNCFAAPDAFRLSLPGFTTYSPDLDVDIHDLTVRDLGDIAIPVMEPQTALGRIEDAMTALWQRDDLPFIILVGGDHAVTAPSARAYCRAHPDQRVGLIHFDAHNDVRVLDHGPTNGTPIRQLLQFGNQISGRNLVQVGISGFMNASYYKRWVEGHGGTIFTGRQVRRTGMDRIVEQTRAIAGADVDAIYVTVDVDVMEAAYTPGTGAATAEGIHPTDLFDALFALGQDPKVKAIDFVEHDPFRDVSAITGRAMTTAMLSFLAGYFLRTKGADGWRGYDPTPITED